MWKMSHYEDSACYNAIQVVDSKGEVVCNSESYYPCPVKEHHANAMVDAMRLVEELSKSEVTALDMAYFKGWAKAIRSNLGE